MFKIFEFSQYIVILTDDRKGTGVQCVWFLDTKWNNSHQNPSMASLTALHPYQRSVPGLQNPSSARPPLGPRPHSPTVGLLSPPGSSSLCLKPSSALCSLWKVFLTPVRSLFQCHLFCYTKKEEEGEEKNSTNKQTDRHMHTRSPPFLVSLSYIFVYFIVFIFLNFI